MVPFPSTPEPVRSAGALRPQLGRHLPLGAAAAALDTADLVVAEFFGRGLCGRPMDKPIKKKGRSGAKLADFMQCDPRSPAKSCSPESYCFVTGRIDQGPFYCCPA